MTSDQLTSDRLTSDQPGTDWLEAVHHEVLCWFEVHRRDLPWRDPATGSWPIFVCEVMSQQTPVARVEPVWRQWLQRWPPPADLAAEVPGEAVRAWDRLGYPRRALRLHAAATIMVQRYHGQVPDRMEDLLSLPGVGSYTAAAVMAFAFGVRCAVVDTNVRRVLARLALGHALPAPALTRAESDLAMRMLPLGDQQATDWNIAAMELGALVCTARSPRCGTCPVRVLCTWQQNGAPEYTGPARRTQAWAGTDRQVRGALLALLRRSHEPLTAAELVPAWPDDAITLQRCLDSLIRDELVQADQSGYRLPGTG